MATTQLISAETYELLDQAIGGKDLPMLQSQLSRPGLVRSHEDETAKGRNGQGLAAQAARVDWPEGIEAIAAAGASLEIRDDAGRPPLFTAIMNLSHSCVDKLVALGADSAALDANGNTALHLALMGRDDDMISHVARLRPWRDSVSSKGYSCLAIAATHDTARSLETLAGLGFDPSLPAPDGHAPLLVALSSGQGSCACSDWLLARGADPNTADAQGWTPLKRAIIHDEPQLAMKLILAGADLHHCPPDQHPDQARSALQLAERLPEKAASQAILGMAQALALRSELGEDTPPAQLEGQARQRPAL